MLDGLKSLVYRDKTNDIIMEATYDTDVKDIFLDDMDAVVLGAENDPNIKRLIDQIPAYEETDREFEQKIEAITESALFDLN